MPWFKVDDSFHSHPKAMATSPAAIGLWTIAGSWSSANLTEGFVPDHALPRLVPDSAGLAKELVAAGLWKRKKGGYQFHDWLEQNPSKDSVQRDRKDSARRQALSRNPEMREAVRHRDGNMCRYCGIKVRWNDRRGPHGGTYDHVDPNRPIDLHNVVVACRSCGSLKKDKTPGEAGLDLDEPRSRSKSDSVSASPPTRPEGSGPPTGDPNPSGGIQDSPAGGAGRAHPSGSPGPAENPHPHLDTHTFTNDGYGTCRECDLPNANRIHQR